MAKKPRDLVVGDNLEVHLIGGVEPVYCTIKGMDNMFYEDAHSAVSAADTESYAEVSNLDPPTGQLYYFDGVEVDGNVKVRLKQPAATNRWGTNKSPEGGLITMIASGVSGARNIDIWVAEDYPPNVQLENFTDVSITPTLFWNGLRFSVRKLPAKPEAYTPIKIGGISE